MNKLINPIYNLLKLIEENYDFSFTTVLFQYLALKIIFTISLILLLVMIYLLQYHIVSLLYFKFIKNSNYITIKLISEVYYFVDKLLYKISPSAINVASFIYFKEQDFNLNRLSILVSIKKITYLLKNTFKPSLPNVFIYLILIFYYQHNFIFNLNLNSFILEFKKIDLKLVNSISTLVLLLVSFLIIFLFRSPFIQSKAKKKIYDNMYEQIFEQQLTLSTNLIPLLNKSSINIQQLNKQLDYVVQNYCEDLTNHLYTWSNNNLERKIKVIHYNPYRDKSNFDMFEDFTNELNAIDKSFEKLNTNIVKSIFLNLNKKVRYECLKLSLYPNNMYIKNPNITHGSLNHSLLNKSYIEDLYNKRIENSTYIKDRLNDYSNLKDYEINYLEKSIIESVATFHMILRQDFEESIYYHILCVQFINHIENKNHLKLKDWLLTK